MFERCANLLANKEIDQERIGTLLLCIVEPNQQIPLENNIAPNKLWTFRVDIEK